APEELVDRSLRTGRVAAREARKRAEIVQPHDLHLDRRLRELLANDRVLRGRRGGERLAPGERDELVEQLTMNDHLAGIRAPLVGERRVGDPPAVVKPTDEVLARYADVFEKDFVEFRAAGHLPKRTDGDPGARHVDDQEAQ